METQGQVHLVFKGEVLPGFQPAAVQQALTERLRMDAAGVARLFEGGRRSVLKRFVSPSEAARYVSRFAAVGALLHLEPVATPAPPAAAPPAPVPGFPVLMADPAPERPPAPPWTAPPASAPTPAPEPVPSAAPAEATPSPPLAPEDLIVCPHCDERQSRRVLCRSCATNMPMGIAAREEALAQAMAERQALRDAARGGRRPDGAFSGDQPALWGLGLAGRMGRLRYATLGLMVTLALYVPAALVINHPSTGRIGLLIAIGLFICWPSVRGGVLRLHDLNLSGWWSVLWFVPYVGQGLALVLTFVPGSRDDNNHGDKPTTGSWGLFGIAAVVTVMGIGITLPGVLASWVELQVAAMEDGEDGGLLPMGSEASTPRLSSQAAARAFRDNYQQAPPFKAFAASADGPWGFTSGAPSLDAAIAKAHAACDARRRPSMAPCETVDASAR